MQIEHVPRIKFLHGTLIVILAWLYLPRTAIQNATREGGGGEHGVKVFIYRGFPCGEE